MSIKLIAPAGVGGVVMGRSGSNYVIASDGTIANVQPTDVDALMNDGFMWAVTAHRQFTFPAPVAAGAAVTVASTALSNGTLTIAAQPDVSRQLQAIINPGTTAI
jgi:acyl dehydratase